MTARTKKKEHIIILGGGAAGLNAARELATNCNVTILEAQGRLGGRINTIIPENLNHPIEAGAEFMHGQLPLTSKLIREAGVKSIPLEGKMFNVTSGSWNEQEDMFEGFDDVIKKIGALEQDMSMEAFLDQFYRDEKHEELKRNVRTFVQGFDLANTHEVSVKQLYKEWNNQNDEDFRIVGGYGQLISFLESECRKKGCMIYTNTVGKKVEWKEGEVVVHTCNGKTFSAQKLIVTVPIILLQSPFREEALLRRKAFSGREAIFREEALSFSPSIDDFISAAQNIGYGNVIKIAIQFKELFWEKHKKEIGFISSKERVPTWWTQLPNQSSLLTGWIGGPPADELCDESDDDILEIALRSLANIFSMPAAELRMLIKKAHIFNWAKQQWIRGGYCYPTVFTAAAIQKLKTPLANTIYFAGEAVYDGDSPGTVEAALYSGKEVAKNIGF